MEILRKISSVIDAISEYTGRIVAWLTLVIVLVGAFNAILRYWAGWQGIAIGEFANTFIELQTYLFAALFLLGAAYTLKQGAHVRVDVLYDRFSLKTRALLNLIGHILFLVPFCIFMLWASKNRVINSWGEWSPDPGGLPLFPFMILLPIAFILLLIQAVGEILKQILQLRGEVNEEPKPEAKP
ncbi:MAG: TRAP transporter small permease subunit [Verrucomicrobiota bacterium]